MNKNLLNVLPEHQVLIACLQSRSGLVLGYTALGVFKDWGTAIEAHDKATENRLAGKSPHIRYTMVRSTRDPRWQHLLIAASTARLDKHGHRRNDWDTARSLLRVTHKAGQTRPYAGGWVFVVHKDRNELVQGAHSALVVCERRRQLVFVEAPEKQYIIVCRAEMFDDIKVPVAKVNAHLAEHAVK